MRSVLIRLFVFALVLLGHVRSAEANEGKPEPKRGEDLHAGAETPGIPEIVIARETLELDFRPLDTGGVPRITARYELVNDGETLIVPLVFASFDVGEAHASLDGTPVAITPLAVEELPHAWSTPDGPVASNVQGPGASGFSFQAEIEAGAHVLEVSYALTTGFETWSAVGPLVRYALDPARSWRSLDVLEVTVRHGASCEVRPYVAKYAESKMSGAEPRAFKRTEPGVWFARYDGIPAPVLFVEVRRDPPWYFDALRSAFPWLGLLLMLALSYGGGQFLLLPRHLALRVLMVVPLTAIALTATCGLAWIAIRIEHHVQTETGSGYGGLLVAAGAFVSGLVAAWIAAPLIALAIAAWRKRRGLTRSVDGRPPAATSGR